MGQADAVWEQMKLLIPAARVKYGTHNLQLTDEECEKLPKGSGKRALVEYDKLRQAIDDQYRNPLLVVQNTTEDDMYTPLLGPKPHDKYLLSDGMELIEDDVERVG